MKFIFAISACIVLSIAHAQVEPNAASKTEQQLEKLAENRDEEPEDDSYLQSLEGFRRHRINLNTADAGELKEFLVLTDLQIQNFLRYRSLLGNFISIYELQAIPVWDVETIRRLLPFIRIGAAEPLLTTLRQKAVAGDHTLLIRAQVVPEKSEGYSRPDSIANRYYGSPERLLVRYKYTYRNLLQYGITADKDAGEQFFKGKQQSGFDFYSFHLFMRKVGIVKLLALGDFTVNLGQGLIQWQSLAFKKGPNVLSVKRQSDLLRPYNSAGEYNFHRGAGIMLSKNNISLTGFASVRKIDARVHGDTSTGNNDFISSVSTAGYHRTPAEIAAKNRLQQIAFGGNISYRRNTFYVGLNGVTYTFSAPLQRDVQPYNQYAIRGRDWHNYSVDYSYTYRNLHLFGEAATDKNRSLAVINGLVISLDKNVDASLVYRNITERYLSLYGNAFTENTLPNNEKGIYAGISIRPLPVITIDAYADLFRFPWLRFRADAPGVGSEYMVQLTYRPDKTFELYSNYRSENKASNIYGLLLPLRPVIAKPRYNWRTQFSYRASREVMLKSRIELVWYDPRNTDEAQQGFSGYFEAAYKSGNKPYTMLARLQYFETDGYESRVYTYENDVLYSYSIPFLFGKGMRYYLNFSYDVSKKLTCWLRFAQTVYKDQNTIGSGLDEITGNKKSELKVQVIYRL